MKTTFLSAYSKKLFNAQGNDAINFPDCIPYQKKVKLRYNNSYYSDSNKNFITKIIKTHKQKKIFNLFYFNQYKKIDDDILSILPYETYNYVTQEVLGISVFAKKENNTRCIYTKYKKRDIELENLLRTEMNCKYLIDKYGSDYILEFKLFNGTIFLVNMFNKFGPVDFEKIEYVSDWYDIKIPRKINCAFFKQGIKTLDNFFNDYYLNTKKLIKNIDYYITFKFRNNFYLFYKL